MFRQEHCNSQSRIGSSDSGTEHGPKFGHQIHYA
jgi:hypothetical protein